MEPTRFDGYRYPSPLSSLADAVGEANCQGLQALVDIGLLERLEASDAGGHRYRVTGQCARLVHRSKRGHHLHDIPAASVGTHGQAATDDLAQAGDVRRHPVQSLGTTVAHPEPGDHLVEDQESPMLLGRAPQPLEEVRCRRDDAHVARHRLHDDACDVASMGFE